MEANKRAMYEEVHHEVRRQMKLLEEQRLEKQQGTPDYRWLSRKQGLTSLTERQQQLMENLANKLSEEDIRKSLKLLETSLAGCNISAADVPEIMNKILKQLIEEHKMTALFRERPKQARKAVRSLSFPKDMQHKGGAVDAIETIAAEVESKQSYSDEA